MLIRTHDNLHYPVTVTKLLVQPGTEIKSLDPLFRYTYTSKVTEGDEFGEKKEVDRTFYEDFKSEVTGKLGNWDIKEGAKLEKPGVRIVHIEEPCTHEELFGNLCVNCGVDVTTLDNYMTAAPNASRATVNTAHSNTALKISSRLATKRSDESKRRLLESKKLSLVVDLDQTIIHATVDPTVAEWQKDPENPNYEAVKDVKAFQLLDDGPGMRGCWYYIKLRPGLEKFLEDMAQKYELHVYTMGTRAYAQNVVKIVDPQHKYFGDRILSRDESGSMTMKHLARLFPVDTDMVAIIDDRADVWSWSANLIKVAAYDFFVGIGDINSSFLPKQQSLGPKPEKPKVITNGMTDGSDFPGAISTNAEELAPASDLEAQLVAMASAESEADFTAQTESQEEAIATQIEDRPLLKRQEALDQLDEAEAQASGETSDTASEHSQHHRHHLLQDNDDELFYLTQHLENVHKAFFEEYENQKKRLASNRVAELRGDKSSPKKPALIDDLTVVPDIKVIMPAMKSRVLEGVVVCFTGIIAQGLDHKKHDLGMWVQSFGGRININLTAKTTHVIAHKDRRTSKVRQATQYDKIQIVAVSWLLECFSKWEHVEEFPHLIDFGKDNGPQDSLPLDDELEDGMIMTPSEDGEGPPKELPEDEPEPLSAVSAPTDWDEMNREMADFLGSDDESYDSASESDLDSDASEASTRSGRSQRSNSRKRKRAPSSVGDGRAEDGTVTGEGIDATAEPSAENATGSALQKRRKKANERTTGLANMLVVEKSSGLPSPETTGPEEANDDGVEDGQDEEGAEIDDDDSELERMMMEEFENDPGEEDDAAEEYDVAT